MPRSRSPWSVSTVAPLAVAVLPLCVAGAAHAGGTDDLQRAFEVASQRAALAEEAVMEMEARLASLEALLKDGGATGSVEADVAATRGAVEEITFKLEGLDKAFADYQLDQERRLLWSEQRLAALEHLLVVQPPPPPCVGPPEQCPKVETATPVAAGGAEGASGGAGQAEDPADPSSGASAFAASNDRIALARERMAAGQQAAARAILEAELQRDETAEDVPELRYRIGEAWLNEGKYRQAARAFRDVTDRHASSEWAPWALLRSGECFEGMGHADDARVFYQSILQSYPSSEAAAQAKKRLRR